MYHQKTQNLSSSREILRHASLYETAVKKVPKKGSLLPILDLKRIPIIIEIFKPVLYLSRWMQPLLPMLNC